MGSSLKRFKRELSRIWSFLNKTNWRIASFTPEKAYVCAIFSKIAYLNIPDFEVRYRTLAKVIPCLTYQQLIASGNILDIAEFLRTLDFANSFVITKRYVVAVGVITPNVIFIALRGTRPLYISDWMIDFNTTRTTAHVNFLAVKIHSGFYTTITDCIDEIAVEIQRRIGSGPSKIPVYIVGHSLGGALAAIAHALSQTRYSSYQMYGLQKIATIDTFSSFTFGMPRYGDRTATETLRSPFHTYNDRDVVPGVPPRWMGFENAPIEYRSSSGSLVQLAQDQQSLKWLLQRIHLAKGIRYHFIERYIRRIGKAAGIY